MEAVGFINSMFSSSTELDWKLGKKVRCPVIEFVKTRDFVENIGMIQVVVQLAEKVSIDTVRTHLHFLYTGELPPTILSPVQVSNKRERERERKSSSLSNNMIMTEN